LREDVDLGAQRSNRVLYILNLEDDPLDTELIQTNLTEGGITCEITRVETRTDFEAALKNGGFDLILGDYSLPAFDGVSALKLAKAIRPEVSFILVSGAIGEERAIEALKSGATDYVLKQHLERLVPAVRRVVEEVEERSKRKHLQEALRRSERQFRTLIEQIPAVTYTQKIADPGSSTTNPTLYASPQIESQSGYPPQAFIEDPELWIKLLHPEDRERVLVEDRRTDETGEPFRMEYRQITRDGRIAWIRDEAALVRDEEGIPRFWQGVMYDITERKEAERTLKEAEQRFRALVQYSSDVITMIDAGGTIRYVSPAVARVTGYRPENLVGKNVFDYVHQDVSEEAQEMLARLWSRPGLHPPFEFRVPRRDGTWGHAEFLVNNLLDDPNVGAVVVNQRDITERKRAEEALREGEERFRSTFQQAAVGIAHVALDGRWLRVNGKLCEILGYNREELLGMTFQAVTHPEDLHKDLEQTKRLLAGEVETHSMEKRFLRKDGSVIWANVTVSLARGTSGEPAYFIPVIMDITQRKRTEEALKQNEELYRTVIEQSADSIFLVDVETKRILEVNASLPRVLGYEPDELKEMTLYDVVAHDRESVDNNIRRLLNQKHYSVGERKYRRKDGSLVDVEVNASVVPYATGEAMCIVAHDVTTHKRVESELRHSLSVLLALREASEVLGSTLKSEEIVTRLLEIMRGVSGLTAAVISVQPLSESGSFPIWRSVGLESLWPKVRYAPEAARARQAALESQVQLFVRLRRPGSVEDESLEALYLPLKVKDRVVGVLEAYGPEPWTRSDMTEVLSSLASQAASALENAQLYEELGERERALQDLVGKLLRAQEEERRRVAYEVHDGLAQVAVAAHQRLQAFARRHPPAAERGQRDLQRILDLVRRTVSDARRIIANLRPTTLDDLGLAATISLEVERMREEGYEVDYASDIGEERLPGTLEITLFRAAQEALTNMRKHARARRVRIELRRDAEEVSLEIEDDGRGIDSAVASLSSGPGERVGLAGMRERIGALGGTLEIRSSAGAGTSLVASVPLTRVH
jgi:PAS domain S-box-containing protein